jgi:hypothetical protein
MSTLESLIKQLRNGAPPFSPALQKANQERRGSKPLISGGPLSSPILPTSVMQNHQQQAAKQHQMNAVNKLQHLVTSQQHAFSGSVDRSLSMSVSGHGDSIADPHGHHDSSGLSGQVRSVKAGGVIQGAAANNFSFFNLN